MHHRDDADEGHAHATQANNANNRCTVRDSSALEPSRSGSWIIVPPMIDRGQRLLFSDPTCCNRFRLVELPSLWSHFSCPLLSSLSNRPKFARGYAKGKSGQLRSEGPTTTISRNFVRESVAVFAGAESNYYSRVRRNEDGSRVMKLDACQKQIANIFVVTPFSLFLSLYLSRNFCNRHSSLGRNIFMRFSFFFFLRVYKRREEVLDLILAPIEKNLNVIVVVLPRCGNCLR